MTKCEVPECNRSGLYKTVISADGKKEVVLCDNHNVDFINRIRIYSGGVLAVR